jgi:hypothetical protein
MKKQMLYRIAATLLFLFFGKLAASAAPEDLVKFEAPFEFQVNEQRMPAGEYIVKRDKQAPQLLLIQSTKRKTGTVVHTMSHLLPKYPARTSLIFTQYNDQHFLSEVRLQGTDYGYALIKSKTERRLARAAKANTVQAIPKAATTEN